MQKDLVLLLVNPSNFARSIGLYILELGHYFQDGETRTLRIPEDSYSLYFEPENPRCTVARNHTCDFLEPDGSHEGYFIHFGGPLADVYCGLLMEENEERRIYYTNSRSPYQENFEQLREMYTKPASVKRDTCAAMVMTGLLARLMVERDSVRQIYPNNTYVCETIKIIEKRYAENLKIRDIAEELDCNPSYLSRIFNEETGLSFPIVLTDVRISHAKELLQTTDLSMSQISAQCGFCNTSHFVKVFHDKEGITPLKYRMLKEQA